MSLRLSRLWNDFCPNTIAILVLHTYREYDRIVAFQNSLVPPVSLHSRTYEAQCTLPTCKTANHNRQLWTEILEDKE